MKSQLHTRVLFLLLFLYGMGFGWAAEDNVKIVTGESGKASYEERLKLIHGLGNDLSKKEIQRLVAFLSKPVRKDFVAPDSLATLKNDVADKLIAQKTLPQGLSDVFVNAIDDVSQTVVWRDYALQKLPELYLKLSEKDKKNRAKLLDKLWAETDHAEATFSGTALLGLRRLSSKDQTVSADETAKKAMAIAKDERHPLANRVTALQVAASMGEKEALFYAREILAEADGSRPIMLRVSALATLGIMGTKEDVAVLAKVAESSEYRLRKAAQAALEKVAKR